MKILGIKDEDFVNYKKCSMTILFAYCSFKCGRENCQNIELEGAPQIEISPYAIVERYMANPLSEAFVFSGLEPFAQYYEMTQLMKEIREHTTDPIIVYTGYSEDDPHIRDYWLDLCRYGNVIIKFGAFIPGHEPHYDDVLGVKLASPNQYGKQICLL